MTAQIAVFAGTQEGHELCCRLARAGIAATCYVATEYGERLVEGLSGIEIRRGRLDAPAMADELAGVSLVVDATHPYAVEVSANLRAATDELGVRYLRLLRPSDLGANGPDANLGSGADAARVEVVDTAEAACELLARLEGRVLVTTGSKDLATYTSLDGFAERLVVRVLPSLESLSHALELGFAAKNVVCMQGPFSRELNVAMLKQVGASWLLTKDTGSAGGLPQKLEAAREAACGVILISRPDKSERGVSLEKAFEACRGVSIPVGA